LPLTFPAIEGADVVSDIRQQTEITSAEAVARFDAAFARQDVDAVMAAMTEDCVFESTAPPDGVRHIGQDAVRAAWVELFASSPDAVFSTEEQLVCGDRVVSRWLYRFSGGHVRGIDVFRIRDGLVAEKCSYVKG
jgi:ketosteroid isomerase-like protein